MLHRPRPLAQRAAVLTLCLAASACSVTGERPSEEYLHYTELLELNEERFRTCSEGFARQYAASSKASPDKIAQAAMAQCKVYGGHACHARVEREALDVDPSLPTLQWREERKAACRESLSQSTGEAIASQLQDAKQ